MNFKIKTMAEYAQEGKTPEILFWVGDAISFDERAKNIAKAFCKILQHSKIEFAILGNEEKSTGDFAKRAGNEFLFQMMAFYNIETLNHYGIKTIVTTCPHCFNTLKNEYSLLGGDYQVYHHTQFIKKLVEEGRLNINSSYFKGNKITFQDPCYLGRANKEYSAPRKLLLMLGFDLIEMKRHQSQALCCGAGGAQFFKEAEKGNKEINIERAEEALDTKTNTIATGCPYCMLMLTDGVKHLNQNHIAIKDIAELIAEANGL